jgi:hypothetical protein
MKRRDVLGVSSAIVLGLAFLPGSAVGQQKSLKDQLVGTWTLVSWTQTNPDGSTFQRFGANPKGVNIFDANGRFFSMFARPDLPKVASNNPSNPTPEEGKAIVGGAISYFGTYTVDEAAKVLALRLDASSYPNLVGIDNKRTIISLEGDDLKYGNPAPTTGGKIEYVFKRAK